VEDKRSSIIEEIVKWIEDMSSPSTLWLTGLAGMGKPAISKTVCLTADTEGSDIVVCLQLTGLMA